jgi:TIR domain
MPAATGDQQVPRPQEVFISYSRKDKEFVRRLDEELKRRDREAWVDWEGIPPGDKWEKTIYGAIEATHTFIFVLTPDSIASEVCGREIEHAAANNKRLVPIVHRDVADDEVPKSLGELNWIFFRDSDDFEEASDILVRALDTDLNWVRATHVSSPVQLSGTQTARTRALFCAVMICGRPSSGSRRLALTKNASPQHCKPNTSLPAAKPLRGGNGSLLVPLPSGRC